jgi:hypothetical protein
LILVSKVQFENVCALQRPVRRRYREASTSLTFGNRGSEEDERLKLEFGNQKPIGSCCADIDRRPPHLNPLPSARREGRVRGGGNRKLAALAF